MSDNSYIKNRLELLSDADYVKLVTILLPRLGSYSYLQLLRYLDYLEGSPDYCLARHDSIVFTATIDSPNMLNAKRDDYNTYLGSGRWQISKRWKEVKKY